MKKNSRSDHMCALNLFQKSDEHKHVNEFLT